MYCRSFSFFHKDRNKLTIRCFYTLKSRGFPINLNTDSLQKLNDVKMLHKEGEEASVKGGSAESSRTQPEPHHLFSCWFQAEDDAGFMTKGGEGGLTRGYSCSRSSNTSKVRKRGLGKRILA